MSQSDRAIKKLATDLARLKHEVVSWRGAQADFTSIENGGNFTFKDGDGNVTAIMGGQDDGSNTIRHVDGPTPPVPAGLSSHVDGPIIQATWDGTFEDGVDATYDWSHLEVLAVGPNNEQLRSTINDVTGASASLAATTSGEWAVYARSVSRAEKRSVDGDAGTVEVELTDLSGAIEDVQQSANGKNNVTYSESPPTEADEGIVGDTWFVGATDSESGNWNVVAQYQYTVEGWTPVELSHEVIATVDLGKATVGELDGIRIMGETIRGEQLSGDAIDGKVITGATYRTSGGNGSWSDAGLFIAQPDGTSMVRFPTDGSPLSLTASDVQIERASIGELDLSYGSVRSGGEFTLASGVTAPASPPELTTGWQKVASLPNPEERADVIGLASWGDKWVRGVNVLGTGEGDRVEIYNNGGSFDRSIPIAIDPQQGVTVIGDVVYVLGKDHDRPQTEKYVFGYDLNTGARVTRWLLDSFEGVTNKLAITTHDGELLVAGVNTAPDFYMFRYNPTTGARLQTYGPVFWDLKYTYDVQGAHFDGTDIYVSHQQATRVYTVSGGALTRKTDSSNASGWAGWYNPNKNGAGMVFVGGAPHVVDSDAVYEGSSTASDYTRELCFTWYDGTHETTASPVAFVDVGARESVTVSLPVRAGLQKRVYYRAGSSGSWDRVDLAESATALNVSGVSGDTYSPPTTNSFPNADPATLKSTNDKFEVKGDGSGHWGHFNVDTNGAMSGMIVTGWAMCYVDDVNNAKKFTIQLPPGRFTRPPVVWASVSTSVPQICSVGIIREETTTTSLSLYFHRTALTQTGVTWYAMDDSEA